MDRASDISLQYGPLQIIRHASKGLFVLAHMLYEGRAPWANRHRVDQQELVIVAPIQQMRAQS